MQINMKDVASGAVFIVIGGYFAISSMLYLRMGDAFSMGPGYFPRILGLVLVALGVAIVVTAIGKESDHITKFAWRGLGLVTLSIVLFGATVRGLGMFPSLFATTYLASIASGKLSQKGALLTSLVIAAGSVVIFIILIGLPYPIIGHWLRVIGG